ncbi:beta-lactamase/transpeptidase-like protein [Calocera viscosa TUFC12733]|uniref:Beta-lactamase/transpeptidase-like protein n=1 Tax=Calocera viscosa (strain TUFC12733) TaxID=1330018 RepID=A0A167NSD2_CALVF|nr:beta-lactamase/transpeptidase-like protein [Calocera viscosa TUFC12733]
MSLKATIDGLLKEYTSKPDGIPGVSLVVTRASGNIYEGAAGLRDLAKPETPFTLDTVMWIASMSKAITSICALIVVERGLIGLDDDLRKVIPELKDLQVIDRTKPYEDGNYTLKPAQKAVTLRHMLTHSNGILYSQWYPHSQAYADAHGIPGLRSGTRAAFKFPAWHEAGEEWHYGMGIDYAGLVVEHVSGLKLGEFMRENLFEPLGMASTSFNLRPELLARKAAPYNRTDGKIVPSPTEFFAFEVEQESGGGGLWSCAEDYAKFLRMILSGGKAPDGKQLIKKETLDLGMQGHLEPAAKKSINEVYQTTNDSKFPGAKRDYGLFGMTLEEDLPTGRPAGSIQWDGAPSCHWFVDTKTDVALVQCVQILPFGDPEVQKLLRAVELAVYKSLKA